MYRSPSRRVLVPLMLRLLSKAKAPMPHSPQLDGDRRYVHTKYIFAPLFLIRSPVLKIDNKKKRAALTDFERYKVMVARQKRAKIIKAAM